MTNQSPLGDVAMQRDGNDEEAVIEAANGSSLAWAMELEEAEGRASNTQQAAAIGAKLFGEITEDEAKAFRDRERWTDNTKFQREDFERSCDQLNIATPDLLRVEGMLSNLELKKHQVIGAAWILQMLDTPLRGCCLADSVGLGKTVTTLAMIQHRYNMREREPAQRVREAKHGLPKPILIVVVEIDMQADRTKRTRERLSYGRIVSKHGPTELKKWRLSRAGFNPGQAEAAEKNFGVQDPEWPNDLRDKFQMVIIDEAHHIKSAERSSTFIALLWFRARLRLAITATPTINRIDDFGGILSFLEPEGLWEQQRLQSWGVTNDVNPFQNRYNTHPASILRCTAKCFGKFLLRSRDERERANLLEKIYSICMLKRNYASRIPFDTGIPIGEDIPPMQVRTVELKFSAREVDRYTPMHNAALSCLTKVIDDSTGKKRVVFDMQIWRALSHFATWIGFEHCLDIKGDDLQEYRNSDFNLQDLITKICAENPTLPPLQTPDEPGILSWFAEWSPKLRYFSYLIAEICVKQREKIVVWVGAPWEQLLLEGYLKTVEVDVRSIYGGMSMNSRQNIIDAFHTDRSSPMVLICTYMINSCGLNLHGHCRNVLLFSPAPSQPVEQQAIGRCRRIGQTMPQRVWRLFLRQSWDEWAEGNALVKLLPTFMAEMNSKLFAGSSDGVDEEIVLMDKFASIRRFVLVDNELEFGDDSMDRPLTPEEIAKELVKVLHGQGSVRKKERKAIQRTL
ncbi:MAG: hypothetical protein M1839_008488 [Geoglossum umbratile]|nr:MAG: hypothetical protein M1839_008488 [Geoglossum umbratile]